MKEEPGRSFHKTCLILCFLLVIPSFAFADAGIPMLALFLPGLVVLFVPIVLIETAVAKWRLSLTWRRSIYVSTLANLASTLLGVPITWLAMAAVEILLGGITFWMGLEGLWDTILLPFWAPWLPPLDESSDWVILAVGAVLCVPFFFASVWVEMRVATAILGKDRRIEAKRWAYIANLVTYAPMMVTLFILSVVQRMLID